jgi:hypothetical protein
MLSKDLPLPHLKYSAAVDNRGNRNEAGEHQQNDQRPSNLKYKPGGGRYPPGPYHPYLGKVLRYQYCRRASRRWPMIFPI